MSEYLRLKVKSNMLKDRRIALCVTGSVAAINAPKLARELRRHGADVVCYMTESATKYVLNPHVMEWATGNKVVTELTGGVEHLIDFDLVVVYPATYNTICKIANGIADNPVTTLCASTDPSKIVIAPAMSIKLYSNPILKRNIEVLKSYGVRFIEPIIEEGAAKIADIDTTVNYIIRFLNRSGLRDSKVLILAGPTRYDIDAVRYISSKSTGLLGYYLAMEAFWRGCDLKVIYGPGEIEYPDIFNVERVYTTEEMLDKTIMELSKIKYDIAIFVAAILDYKPSKYIDAKIKSGGRISMELIPTPKVIDIVRSKYPDLFIVGFKLEYKIDEDKLIEEARRRLNEIKPGIIIANDISKITRDRHRACIIYDGGVKIVDSSKDIVAREVFNIIEEAYLRFKRN